MTIAIALTLGAGIFAAMVIGVWTGEQKVRRAIVTAPAREDASPVATASPRDI
jgi:hypothetical protein